MSEKVQNQLSQNLSFSNSKTPGRHQGGDFLLGQKVQRQKLIAPKGVVEKSVWHTKFLKVFCTFLLKWIMISFFGLYVVWFKIL